jgi:uncharacterized RDD family membrane protein YckC
LHSIDKLTIDTPEQIALELPLAGIGSRSLACIIDSLIQIALAFLIFLISLGLTLAFPGSSSLVKSIGIAAMILVLFFLVWGYFALFEIIWNGQTPGKRIAGIRVINESGRPINPVESIGRNLVRIIDFLPAFYAVGLICMMLNKRNKRLGDFVAGTLVIHDKSVKNISPVWNPNAISAATDSQTTDSQATQIPSEVLVLIETYLNRRYELEAPVRIKTAGQIVSMIKDKTGIEQAVEQSNDTFLESLARKVRDTARYR